MGGGRWEGAKVGSGEVERWEAGRREVGSGEVGRREVGRYKVGRRVVRSGKVEVGRWEVGRWEVGRWESQSRGMSSKEYWHPSAHAKALPSYPPPTSSSAIGSLRPECAMRLLSAALFFFFSPANIINRGSANSQSRWEGCMDTSTAVERHPSRTGIELVWARRQATIIHWMFHTWLLTPDNCLPFGLDDHVEPSAIQYGALHAIRFIQ